MLVALWRMDIQDLIINDDLIWWDAPLNAVHFICIDFLYHAPTAMNQQKFYFELKEGKIKAKPGFGFYTKIDLGIAKYNFEIGAGRENFSWSN